MIPTGAEILSLGDDFVVFAQNKDVVPCTVGCDYGRRQHAIGRETAG